MVLNQSRFKIDVGAARALVERLRRALGLGGHHFNVCFVEDGRIGELNRKFRGKRNATDVLSFPWHDCEASLAAAQAVPGMDAADLDGFLGDIIVSVETASRNAAVEGHALGRETDWLIVHGLLHLLGMDHEKDNGEMTALEYDLRARLGLDSGGRKLSKKPAGGKRRMGSGRNRKPTRPLFRRTAA
jgi:probable rRNA maturation factor